MVRFPCENLENMGEMDHTNQQKTPSIVKQRSTKAWSPFFDIVYSICISYIYICWLERERCLTTSLLRLLSACLLRDLLLQKWKIYWYRYKIIMYHTIHSNISLWFMNPYTINTTIEIVIHRVSFWYHIQLLHYNHVGNHKLDQEIM